MQNGQRVGLHWRYRFLQEIIKRNKRVELLKACDYTDVPGRREERTYRGDGQ